MGLDHVAENSSRAMRIQGNKLCQGTISCQFVHIGFNADLLSLFGYFLKAAALPLSSEMPLSTCKLLLVNFFKVMSGGNYYFTLG